MTKPAKKKDYTVHANNAKQAYDDGLVHAQWYRTPIEKSRFKELMRQSDGPAIRDMSIWFSILIGLGTMVVLTWGSWWSLLFIIMYGGVYNTADARWHECGHGTAFKTQWMNEWVYQIASFMMLRSPTPWKWSHARHHRDTYVIGRDPEIYPRPALAKDLIQSLLNIRGCLNAFKLAFLHSIGKLTESEKDYVPETAYRKTIWEGRFHILIFVSVIASCVYMKSMLPAMLVVLPSFYGMYFLMFMGISQHIGLYENVLDHRLNARTYNTNWFFRFFYWNMNYHIEHHMFSMVPYYNLPKLQEVVKHDYPKPNPSIWSALKESLFAMRMQSKDPDYVIVRELPPTANPYKYR